MRTGCPLGLRAVRSRTDRPLAEHRDPSQGDRISPSRSLPMLASDLARFIAMGRGSEPADLVIRNVRLLDLVTGALTPTDIAIGGERIVGTHAAYRGRREIDAAGL